MSFHHSETTTAVRFVFRYSNSNSKPFARVLEVTRAEFLGGGATRNVKRAARTFSLHGVARVFVGSFIRENGVRKCARARERWMEMRDRQKEMDKRVD